MRKIVIILSTFALILGGCKNKSSSSADLSNNYMEDTLKSYKDTLIDNCFLDFIYLFTHDKEFQLTRSMTELYECHAVSEYAFHIFNSFNIPDKEFELDLTNDKYMSILKPTENKKTTLIFRKIDGRWFLSEIKNFDFDFENTENLEAFLYQFSNDSIFRKEHIKFPLKYEHLDYDNDYEIITDYLTEENTFEYNFFNNNNFVFFHSTAICNEKHILIYLRGIDTGWNSRYYFEKFNNVWKLIEENDYST